MWLVPYPPVVVRRCALHDRADEEGLVAVDLLLAAHDAEAQAAGRAPAQDDVLTAVQVPGGDKTKGCLSNHRSCAMNASGLREDGAQLPLCSTAELRLPC